MKKAIIFGASGLIGSHLLDNLLNNPDYELVTIVVRKDLGISHPKLKVLIGDFHSLPTLKNEIVADEVFITLGTTKKNTPDKREYYEVDHDYPVLAARTAKKSGAKSVFLVTAVGANARSNVFYVKTKGQTEHSIIMLNMDHTHIFRPSMLLGNRKENRPAEKIIMKIWPFVSFFLIGPLSIYKGIDVKDVAKAMMNAAKTQEEKVKIYHWKQMTAYCKMAISSRRD